MSRFIRTATVASGATTNKTLPATQSSRATYTLQILKLVPATQGNSTTITRTVNKLVIASPLATSATVLRQVNKFLTATAVGLTASIQRTINKLVTTSAVSVTATSTPLKVKVANLTATAVATSATFTKTIRTSLQGVLTLTLTPTILRTMPKLFPLTVSNTPLALKTIQKTLMPTQPLVNPVLVGSATSNALSQGSISIANCVIPPKSLVVAIPYVAQGASDPGVPSNVTDGTNTASVADGTSFIGSAGRVSAFSWYDAAGRTATITANYPSAVVSMSWFYVFVIPNGASTSWLDQVVATSSTAATNLAITTSGNVAQGAEISFGLFGRGNTITNPTTWPGAGYTALNGVNGDSDATRQKGFLIEYKNGLTAGSTETAGGAVPSANISRLLVTYKSGTGISTTANFTRTVARILALSAIMTTGATITRTIGKGIVATPSMTATAVRQMGKAMAAIVGSSASFQRTIGKVVATTASTLATIIRTILIKPTPGTVTVELQRTGELTVVAAVAEVTVTETPLS